MLRCTAVKNTMPEDMNMWVAYSVKLNLRFRDIYISGNGPGYMHTFLLTSSKWSLG